MKDHITGLRGPEIEQKLYNYTAVYNPNDCHNDKQAQMADGEPIQMVYRVEVWAQDLSHALVRGKQIANLERMEDMTDYILTHPMYGEQDTFTRSEIKQIRDEAISIGLFNDWVMIEPTSVQCNLVEDEELLKTATLANTLNHIGHTGDLAEDYLKELDNDS